MFSSASIDVQRDLFHLYLDIDYSFQATGILMATPLEIYGISTMLQKLMVSQKRKRVLERRILANLPVSFVIQLSISGPETFVKMAVAAHSGKLPGP